MDVAPAVGYTTRELPPEEWAKIKDLPFATYGLPDPALCAIVVAENAEGEVVAVWAAITAVHLEGLWVRPDHQKTSVGSRLFKAMTAMLRRHQVPVSFTIISEPDVAVLAYKHGLVRAAGDLYMLVLPPEET